MIALKLITFFFVFPENHKNNVKRVQHAIPYLHETFEGLPLPMYSKTDEPSFEDVFKFVKEITSFIVDLTKLDNITDVTGNDGEKMEHHVVMAVVPVT